MKETTELYIPGSFFAEEHHSRGYVREVAERERHNVRTLWPDCYPEDPPRYISEYEVREWENLGLVLKYLPTRRVEEQRLESLPFGMDAGSREWLHRLEPGKDFLQIEGGWFLVKKDPITVRNADLVSDQMSAEDRQAIASLPERVADVLYSDRDLEEVEEVLHWSPQLPNTLELVCFRNMDDPIVGDEPELCGEEFIGPDGPAIMSVRFENRRAVVAPVRTRDMFRGGLRPIWKLPRILPPKPRGSGGYVLA